jgi:hypothetical protein
LSSKDKLPILGEPIVEVHKYDIDEDTLNVRTLGEALEATAHQHVADTLQVVEEEDKCEQTDNESTDKQDPLNIHIRNSSIQTLPT